MSEAHWDVCLSGFRYGERGVSQEIARRSMQQYVRYQRPLDSDIGIGSDHVGIDKGILKEFLWPNRVLLRSKSRPSRSRSLRHGASKLSSRMEQV